MAGDAESQPARRRPRQSGADVADRSVTLERVRRRHRRVGDRRGAALLSLEAPVEEVAHAHPTEQPRADLHRQRGERVARDDVLLRAAVAVREVPIFRLDLHVQHRSVRRRDRRRVRRREGIKIGRRTPRADRTSAHLARGVPEPLRAERALRAHHARK